MWTQRETFAFWWLHVSGSYLHSWSFTTTAQSPKCWCLCAAGEREITSHLLHGKKGLPSRGWCSLLSCLSLLHPAMTSSLRPFPNICLWTIGKATGKEMGRNEGLAQEGNHCSNIFCFVGQFSPNCQGQPDVVDACRNRWVEFVPHPKLDFSISWLHLSLLPTYMLIAWCL